MDRDLLGSRRACDSDRSTIERAAKRPRRAQTVHHRRMEDIVDISMDSPEAHTRAKEVQAHQGSDYGSSSRTRNAELRALWGESGAGPSQAGPSGADEPIRWNRVRRRSSSRAVRPTVDNAAPEEDEVIICPPPDEAKYQQAAECRRVEDIDEFKDCLAPTAFDPLSLASFATRRPPSLTAAYQGATRPSRLAAVPAPPPPCSHDVHPTVLDRTASPAMYHHLPYRMRHHRPYEPFDTALHHHSTRSSAPYEPHRQQDRQEVARPAPMHRRVTREPALEGHPCPPYPGRQSRRVPTNEELAERIVERRQREEARDATFNARALEEAELRLRMEELEALEAAFDSLDAPPGPPLPPPPADFNWRNSTADMDVPRPRQSEGRGRRRGWGPGSLAEAMMGMLGEDALGVVPGARMPHPPRHIAGHLTAMRAAFAGMSSGRLPPHLLFSDRDFNEDDYEALLALDDTVENRKGATKDVIEAIPTVPVPLGGLTETGDRRCPICLEDYVSGTTLRRLHCTHQFHKPCLDKWLQQKATCPICQGECKSCV